MPGRFFLMVGFLRPHVPWCVPQRWFDLYDRDAITLPPHRPDDLDDVPEMARRIGIRGEMPRTDWAIKTDQWRDIVHAYLASTSFADHQVGRVLDALEDSPHRDNTIVVLWSDHGYHMGGEEHISKALALGAVVARSPRDRPPTVQPRQRCDRVVSLLDIYPTLVEMAGLRANPTDEGRSLVPLLTEPTQAWPYPAINGRQENSFAVQTETHRSIRYGDGGEELYDHRIDPHEWHNCAAGDVGPADRDVIERLRSSLPQSPPAVRAAP